MVAAPGCGALAAAFLTEPAAYYTRALKLPLPPDDTTTYAAAFVIGVGAMWISDIVFEQIVSRFKPAPDT